MTIKVKASEIKDQTVTIEVTPGYRVITEVNPDLAVVIIETPIEIFDVSTQVMTLFTIKPTPMERIQSKQISQQISGNARVGTAIAGDLYTTTTNIKGNVHGPVISGNVNGPLHIENQAPSYGPQGIFNGPVDIKTGDIKGSNGVAIGHGASSTVRNVNTGGGTYSERDIEKTVTVNPNDILVTVPPGIRVLISAVES